jgi:uncharacterized protein DUF4238
MASNHHFVPQFYFRQFSEGARSICLLSKTDGRVVPRASIKKQCARNGYYGTQDLDSRLEARHAPALRRLIDFAWASDTTDLEPEIIAAMWEAVVLQRVRTPLEHHKHHAAIEDLVVVMLRDYIARNPATDSREEMLEAIDGGKVRASANESRLACRRVAAALRMRLLISDLRFFPLDSATLLMLYDDAHYTGAFSSRLVFDVLGRYDVAQLNALQLHHSVDSVYFGNERWAEYVRSLWLAHNRSAVPPKASLVTHDDWLLDGEPVDDVRHIFEPQLDFPFELSFLECEAIHGCDYVHRPRSPELLQEYREAWSG